MNLEVIKQVICDSIPDDVSVSNIDVKESGSGLTIKLTWEALKASAPGQLLDDLVERVRMPLRMPLEPLEPKISKMVNTPEFKQRLADECKKYEEDLAKIKEAYRDKLRSELPNEVDEFNNGILKVAGEKVSLFRNGELVCDLNIRFNPSSPYAVQSAWAGDSPVLQNYDVLVVTKPGGSEDHYSIADVKQKNGFQNFSLIKVFGNALGSAKPPTDGKKFANLSEVDGCQDSCHKEYEDKQKDEPKVDKSSLSERNKEASEQFAETQRVIDKRVFGTTKEARDKFAETVMRRAGIDVEAVKEARRHGEFVKGLVEDGTFVKPAFDKEIGKDAPRKTVEGKVVTSIDIESLNKTIKDIKNIMDSEINDEAIKEAKSCLDKKPEETKSEEKPRRIRDIFREASEAKADEERAERRKRAKPEGELGAFWKSEDGYSYPINVLVNAQRLHNLLLSKYLKKEDLDDMIKLREWGFDAESINAFRERYGWQENGVWKFSYGPSPFQVPKSARDFEGACNVYAKYFDGYVKKSPLGNCSVQNRFGHQVCDLDVLLATNNCFNEFDFINSVIKKVKPLVEVNEAENPEKKPESEPEPERPVKTLGKFKRILSHLKAIKDEILHG